MHKKLINDQNGVAFVLEIVMVAFVLAVVGFVGYRVYDSQKDEEQIEAIIETESPAELSDAHNSLGFNLLKTIYSDGGDKNIIISPTSVALALSMVYNGANGETKDAMAKALLLENIDIASVNQGSLELMNELNNLGSDVELAIANSIWMNEGQEFNPDFVDTAKNSYLAEANTLNFASPVAAETINAWVSDNTNDKITTIVDDTSDLVMYLANATYFKGAWTDEFDPSDTRDDTFTSASGGEHQVPFMRQSGSFEYLENDTLQSVSLPYGEDERLSMYVFLPDDIYSFVNSLTLARWEELMGQFNEADGTLLLPRFTTAYETGLIPVLTELGMGVAFEEGVADFSKLAERTFISRVTHKTYLDVNEEGTEAAAVTGVGVSLTSASPEEVERFSMDVDRPFFIAITDSETNEILFSGVVHKP